MTASLVKRFTSRTRHTVRVRFAFGQQLAASNAKENAETDAALKRLLAREALSSRTGHNLLLRGLAVDDDLDLILVQGGEEPTQTASECMKMWQELSRRVQEAQAQVVQVDWPQQLDVEDRSNSWICRQLVLALRAQSYRFTLHPSHKPAERKQPNLKIQILGLDEDATACRRALNEGLAVAEGIDLACDLGNLAPNICTPQYLADEARRLAAEDSRLSVKVLDEKAIEKAGMGALMAVARGSELPARLIAMEYRGGDKREAPVVLVGKGITFDSGGISIKPGAAMDEMKFDMCGAASVFGVIAACQALKLKRNVIGIVVAAENMPDGRACKPGDVITTLSGQSVEILNTDAEGRLVLCDALSWAARYKPDVVIDVATLTGACIVALGHVASAVMGNDPLLVDSLVDTGERCGDPTWALPLWDEYQQQLDSNFADIANIGGPAAGSITAGCFLSRFTQDYTWAHLDIAGVAWRKGKEKSATGRPVSLLMHWLLDTD